MLVLCWYYVGIMVLGPSTSLQYICDVIAGKTKEAGVCFLGGRLFMYFILHPSVVTCHAI